MGTPKKRNTDRFSVSIDPELHAAIRERAKALGFEKYRFSEFISWLIKRDLRDRPNLVFDERGTYDAPRKPEKK